MISRYEVGVVQANGKVPVTEFHTDDLGNVFRIDYGPVPPDTDFQAVMDERLTTLDFTEMVPFQRAA